ncbi:MULTISPECIES: UDP-N-acetylglucosamine 1-carboxyvinyltransferase [Lacticaseibacillus]|uniref:UDP-N-acetylglucosamine 1-carboxyvinyltransferase n=1 Tax=Lacticaseibacillus casei DSM 20011 = JCM 1134 = ATCC 393 TaxID=1423732 RepID=A0AAD1AR17_LACCA|nr:UDP-N-acetylglucosamine 1-carboxyvinyltransferase [Lacticaseibacillus casei]MBI6598769.1 UDP-N-acetylglucosamine 1-carboxyvinyltransferase [Lacticaseibacillus casei]MBO1482415.1 UDP-N-acetylglucosamine 1-carboxyvinyltransferase [Lacticaseibacillus casei]MBO2417668.1 UDP-N-acetylglucosamine 1-carboxyvinyltransferase [Lacticaseibacillus casei]MCK2082059.1 UDP-N-acetylglucosamine 1-carboxyvinyltransferase [Lacticaseibacillus casei]MDZ5495022.1 UDP-N-acetylglucosamine 1-carboxyvinyltransferase 
MEKMLIHGGKKLSGEVVIGGAKNSTVALIPAAILSRTPVTLDSVPHIQDVYNLMAILDDMNVKSDFTENVLTIDPTEIHDVPLPNGKIKSLRASYYFMGALLGRFGKAIVGLPGGDDIGPRPIDQHIKGFEALGASVSNEHGAMAIKAPAEGLHGARIFLDMVSVGATINVILAAVTAKGRTVIENAAKEPEIIDLATYLNNMGAKVRGAGTDVIRISGVPTLEAHNSHTIIPDRIEAGTYLAMAAAVGEGVKVKNIISEHLDAFLAKLEEMGVVMDVGEDSIFVYPSGDLKMVQIKTMPYPGFATDLQQPITPLMLKAHGEGLIIDTIYPKRVRHIPELLRMGADITIENDVIILHHCDHLQGTEVVAEEIRAGACLMIAGLMAEGTTTITKVDNILRGYDRVVMKLRGLGADVELID